MNLLREEYCKEINTPMGLDNVYDYVKWLEKKLTETNQALQLQQTGVMKSVCNHCNNKLCDSQNVMVKIVVWLKEDYSEADEFECSNTLTKEQITEEVNKRYKMWYYYDIW